jgi:hypothetical protein
MKFYSPILLLSLALSAPAYAEKTVATLYLSPSVYQLHGHLNSPYREYWFNQGALFAPIALKTLQEKYADLTLCQSGNTVDRVIKLTPNIFYNPQMRVLHGQVIANVYSGGGTLLGAYVGKAQQVGSIDVAMDESIKKAYAAAMQNLVEKLSLSEQAYTVNSEIKLPCNVVGAQAEPQSGFY